ncbi:unnamed protein product [Dicrocoelium dendriticum]|nr:unnamed protein product [Dicrocoelium dendriticum]
MTENTILCTCFCFRLLKCKEREPQEIPETTQDKILKAKATALATVLFKHDDLFAIERMAKMDKDALKRPTTSEAVEDAEFMDLLPQSFALKAYLRNNSRQITRLALLGLLETVLS